MTQLHRFTGFAISDVVTLAKSRVEWRKEKGSGKSWCIASKPESRCSCRFHELKAAFDALPLPRGASADCSYYFWNGATSRAAIGIAERTMSVVFRKSGVRNA